MKFTKMHGTGNDYIYINGFKNKIDHPDKLSINWSDRHKGIGSDGLVLILPSESSDFRMRMFNADGSEAEMCGNASRCVGKYVYDNGLTENRELTLETLSGEKRLVLSTDENNLVDSVTVNMGAPQLDSQKIPTTLKDSPVINRMVKIDGYGECALTCVSMGNPHAILFLDDIDTLNLTEIGPKFEYSNYFPERTNTEFIEIQNRNRIKMRVWERGSGETMACGTGACAAVVASVLNDFTDRKVKVELLGGELEIEWRESDNQVYLTGGATTVFEGEINDDFTL